MTENLPLAIATTSPISNLLSTPDTIATANVLTLQGQLGIELQGGLTLAYDNISSGIPIFVLDSRYYFIEISNNSTTSVLLPNASTTPGQTFIILKGYSGGSLTVSTQGSNTIDGDAAITMDNLDDRLKLFSSGANRWVIT
jgi:hypothetical protein